MDGFFLSLGLFSISRYVGIFIFAAYFLLLFRLDAILRLLAIDVPATTTTWLDETIFAILGVYFHF